METPNTAKLLELVAQALPVREPEARAATLTPARETIRFLDWDIAERPREPAADQYGTAPMRLGARAVDRAVAIPVQADAEARAMAADDARYFRAGDCCEWRVREVDTSAHPWARGPRCLVFESDAFARRVWRYPAHWRSLPDAALEKLSWKW